MTNAHLYELCESRKGSILFGGASINCLFCGHNHLIFRFCCLRMMLWAMKRCPLRKKSNRESESRTELPKGPCPGFTILITAVLKTRRTVFRTLIVGQLHGYFRLRRGFSLPEKCLLSVQNGWYRRARPRHTAKSEAVWAAMTLVASKKRLAPGQPERPAERRQFGKFYA
jgi:hypothetical protein